MAEINLGKIVVVDEYDQIVNKIIAGNNITLDYDNEDKVLEINANDGLLYSTFVINLASKNWHQVRDKYAVNVTVSGVTSENLIQVTPASTNIEEWVECEIYCSSQNENQLTFVASLLPTNYETINANVVIWGN